MLLYTKHVSPTGTADYGLQNRGNLANHLNYLNSMDTTMAQKVAFMFAFLPSTPQVLADMGAGSCATAAEIARRYPHLTVYGVDINTVSLDLAKEKYKDIANLSFIAGDIEKDLFSENQRPSVFLNSSSWHHVYTFNMYNRADVHRTINEQIKNLPIGGILLNRDFVAPPCTEVILDIPTAVAQDLELFCREARNLLPAAERGYPLKKLSPRRTGWQSYRLSQKAAHEFIWHKDYRKNWKEELLEEYSYFTQNDFETTFNSSGLRVLFSGPYYNPWIIENWYRGQIQMTDAVSEKPLYYPPTNYVIIGEKVKHNQGVLLQEQQKRPLPEAAYLHQRFFRHKATAEVYELIEYPRPIYNLQLHAYDRATHQLHVFAKYGYPRPLINAGIEDYANLNGVQYSGYIIEEITITDTGEGKNASIARGLQQRAGISDLSADTYAESLTFYPSPGGIAEQVKVITIPVPRSTEPQPLEASYSGFKEAGEIRKFDAQQLLRVAQVGGIPSVRLEIMLYELFRRYHELPQPWIGNQIQIVEESTVTAEKVSAVFAQPKTAAFTEIPEHPLPEKDRFLEHRRAVFIEKDQNNIIIASQELEYVIPRKRSPNTVLTLPVCRQGNDYYIALEKRELPAAQVFEGTSTLWTIPAYRLPKDVANLHDLESFIAHALDFPVHRFAKLGEKFFPSTGNAIEQIYPYVIETDPSHIPDTYHFVALKDLFRNLSACTDAQLICGVYRLVHALGLWAEYQA